MQFQVPQFIDIEDKIIGPLSLKQFLYLTGGGAFVMVLLLLFTPFVALFIASPVVALALALAFYKVNGRDFLAFLNSLSKHYLGARVYTWQRVKPQPAKGRKRGAEALQKPPPPKPLPVEKRLKRLAWQLDIMKHQNK